MKWLLWIDIETTGLLPTQDKILQIALVLSSFDLKKKYILGEYTIHYDLSSLQLNEWCQLQHTDSKLLDIVKTSKLSLQDSEQMILSKIYKHVNIHDDVLYLAGNSVHFDKSFIQHHMPNLHCLLHYRIFDISSIKLFYTLKHKKEYNLKKNSHTALSDILESIDEYSFYLEN